MMALVEAAAKAGFDAFKTQAWTVDRMFAPGTIPQEERERRRKLEVPEEWHLEIGSLCRKYGMQYGITVCATEDVERLSDYADFLKIGSYELTNYHLLRAAGKRDMRLVLSTGMATMRECQAAVERAERAYVVVMHAVSSYPCPPEQANLAAIDWMQKKLCVPIGWSDHTCSIEVVQRAVHRWKASWVEMHFDTANASGCESTHSWFPAEASAAIGIARYLPAELPRWSPIDGNGLKEPQPCELAERGWRADPYDGQRPLQEIRSFLNRKE